MAQSANSNPTPDRREAPAHNTTPPNIAIQNGQSTQPGTTSHELPQATPAPTGIATINQASGQKVSSAANPTLESNHGSTMEDEEDMWLAMTTTFDDFFQSVPEENKPPSLQAIEPDVPESKPTDQIGTPPSANDVKIDEVRCLFSTPFAHGFRREVDID